MKLKMKIKPETKEKIIGVGVAVAAAAVTLSVMVLIYDSGRTDGRKQGRIIGGDLVQLPGNDNPTLFLTNAIGAIQKLEWQTNPVEVA